MVGDCDIVQGLCEELVGGDSVPQIVLCFCLIREEGPTPAAASAFEK